MSCTFDTFRVLSAEVSASHTPRAIRRKLDSAGRRARNRRILHLGLVFIAAVIILDALVGDRGLLAMLRVRKQSAALAAALANDRAINARLAEQARRLLDDPAAVEEVARRELGLIKPGEKVFIIKDVPAPNTERPDKR
jgi:cell division protein FtsB